MQPSTNRQTTKTIPPLSPQRERERERVSLLVFRPEKRERQRDDDDDDNDDTILHKDNDLSIKRHFPHIHIKLKKSVSLTTALTP